MADNRALLNLLIQTSTKARRGGGGRGPGSRGGKFWLNANGKVEYGPKPSGARSAGHAAPKVQPKGQRAVARPTHGGSGRAKVGELRPGYRIKPRPSAGKLQGKKRMLSEMDKVIRTGKDPHGNALSPSSLAQLRFLATGLRTEISMGGKKEITAKAKAPSKTDAKIAKVMGEYKKGTLKTGSPKGPKVTNPKQAIAIALSQAAKVGKKTVTSTTTIKHKETDPGGSFTVFKDTKGAWRWVAVSSSGFQDRDGETVSTKALAEDAARCDATGSYGPLDWWHTDVVIGNCDFNAMHGKLLVESGTFNNPLVAQRLAQAIARKEFEAGISLQFRHREPGPHVLPGRVFKNIYKERRALLPMDAASNIATRLEVISPATTGQKSIEVYKVDAIKEQKLIELFGQDVAKEYLSKLAQKEQEFIQAGTAYKAVQVEMAEKAAAALDAPMGVAAMNAAPMAQDKPKVTKKDDLEGMLEPGGDSPGEEMAEGEGEGSDYEDSPTDQEADAIMETLFTRIGQIVTETVKTKVDEILAAVNGLGAASTKEIAAQEGIAIALKETASALTKVTGENTALKEKVTVLESRLGALEGNQPPAVRARASQAQGVAFDRLNPALQQLVNKEKQGEDPYQGDWTLQAAAQMTNSIAQRWQQ